MSVLARRRSAGRTLTRAALAEVTGPALLAAGLCLIGITGRSLGFDEGATVAIASQHGAALWRAIGRDGGNMSAWYLLLHGLVGVFGDSLWVLRLPSLVFAALTPALVVLIGRRLFAGRRVGAIAGWLSAVSLPLVYWGQTARGYAAMLCLGCAGMLAFVALLDAAAAGRPVRRAALGYVLATALAAYCGFIVLLLVVVQLLGIALWPATRERRLALLRRFAPALAALVVLCLPLAWLATRRGSGQLFWVPRPEHQVETQVAQMLASAGLQSTFHRVFTTTPGWIVTAIAIAGLLGLVAARARTRTRTREAATPADPLASGGATLVLLWALVPGLVEFVVSLVAQPVFLPRNLLLSVPAVALALALGLADRRLPRALAAAGLATAMLIRVVPVIGAVDVSPEPWQQVTARVLRAARPGDCIAFYPEDARNALRWAAAADGELAWAPRSVLPAVRWSSTAPYVELYRTLTPARIAALRPGCARMWLVSSHEGQPTGPAEVRAHRAAWLALEAELSRAYGPAPQQTYGWASAIHVRLFGGP